MLTSITYDSGLFLFACFRNSNGKYFNFNTSTWDEIYSTDCGYMLTEYVYDSATFSLYMLTYSITFTFPIILEIWNAENPFEQTELLGVDTIPIQFKFDDTNNVYSYVDNISVDTTNLVTSEEFDLGKTEIINSINNIYGDVLVNHNYPSVDNMRFIDEHGNGIDNAVIIAFLKEDYINNRKSHAYIKAFTTTKMDGRWKSDFMLDKDLTYIVEFYKQGEFNIATKEITT